MNRSLDFEEIIKLLNIENGLILVEGFKKGPGYKLVIISSKEETNLLNKINNVIAVITNLDVEVKYPKFKFEEVNKIVDFIKEKAISHILSFLGGKNCGLCGRKTCKDLAIDILHGKANFLDCHYSKLLEVSLKVNGREVLLKTFPKEVLLNLVFAYLKSLKNIPEAITEVEIRVKKEKV